MIFNDRKIYQYWVEKVQQAKTSENQLVNLFEREKIGNQLRDDVYFIVIVGKKIEENN